MQELIEKLQASMEHSIEGLKDEFDESKKRIEIIERRVEEVAVTAAESAGAGAGIDTGIVSKEQSQFNSNMQGRLADIEREIIRLQRIDFRLNKDLVSKPYGYIDRLRENLEKEQIEIVKSVKANNDKYVTKIQ
mmetsp:Transcript_11573/g.17482  ORF Transcript_11573/g.17482 Transcript_11573/m.17482 type:complete len:134 (+) Transcript_11573:773-1174(+)